MAYTSSACGMGSSSSPTSSWPVNIGPVQLRNDETSSPRRVNGVSESTFEMCRRPNSSCTTIRRHEQLDDGLVKPNEILTEFAPPIIQHHLERVLGTSISREKSTKTREQNKRGRECCNG
jgi:hypothetical protein